MIKFFKLCFTCDSIKGQKKELHLDCIGNEQDSKEPTREAKSLPLDDSVQFERKSVKSVTEDFGNDVNTPSIKNTQKGTSLFKRNAKKKNESGEIPSSFVKNLRNDLLKSAFN